MTRYDTVTITCYEDGVHRVWIWDRWQERYVGQTCRTAEPLDGRERGEPVVFDTEAAAREYLVSIHQDAADSFQQTVTNALIRSGRY